MDDIIASKWELHQKEEKILQIHDEVQRLLCEEGVASFVIKVIMDKLDQSIRIILAD